MRGKMEVLPLKSRVREAQEKKTVISLLGLILMFNLVVAPSIADETGQNANVSAGIKQTLPPEVLERRAKFDEEWERLKNDPDFMKILEREKEGLNLSELFREMQDAVFLEFKVIDKVKFAEDFERRKKQESAITDITSGLNITSIESVEITPNETEVIKIRSSEALSTIYDLEKTGIASLIDAEPVYEVVKREDTTEVFKKIDLSIENGTPVITAELAPDGETSALTLLQDEREGKLRLKSDGIEAVTTARLKLEKTGLFMVAQQRETRIQVLPHMAAETAKKKIVTSITNIELKSIEGTPIYEIKGVKEGKLLAIFPVEMDIDVMMDSSSGKIKSIKKPWWSALVLGGAGD